MLNKFLNELFISYSLKKSETGMSQDHIVEPYFETMIEDIKGFIDLNYKLKPDVCLVVDSLQGIIKDLEYSAFNLCNGKKYTDLPKGIIESTGAEDTLLISIRELRKIIDNLDSK